VPFPRYASRGLATERGDSGLWLRFLAPCQQTMLDPTEKMNQSAEVIYLVDHEPRAREAISAFLTARQMEVVSFDSAVTYLDYRRSDRSACLVLEMQLPGISGLDLQRRLSNQPGPPIVFICGRVDIPCTVRAMKAGAIDVLTKPVDQGALMKAIWTAFAEDRRLRQRNIELLMIQKRLSSLTPRERQVLPLIVGGLLNKQAAAVLRITEVTLQVHRSQIMRKMAAESFADLVRMAEKLCIAPQREWDGGELLHRAVLPKVS
jgi:FixJ family two-component response regulator